MKIRVALALQSRQVVVDLELPTGSTVGEAIGAACRDPRMQGVDVASMRPGVWARACTPGTVLREGDRVELYRPLAADPKEMRRARTRKPVRG